MGFVLKYCDECHKRIPEEDFISGKAVEANGHTYCKLHVPENFKNITKKVNTPSKKISKARIDPRKYKTSHIRRAIDSATEVSKRRNAPSNRNRELRLRKENGEQIRRKPSGRAYPPKIQNAKESGRKVVPFIPIVGLLIIAGVIVLLITLGSSNPENDNSINKSGVKNPYDLDTSNSAVKTSTPKESASDYQVWMQTFKKINKDYNSVVNNPETDETSENIEILAYKDYRIALKLKKSIEDNELTRLISKENIEILENELIPGFGEFAADSKCRAVLNKTDKLLNELDYETAVQYLQNILAGELETDFPKLLLNKNLLCYRKMNNKFTEISSIFEKNKDMIFVSKIFMEFETELYSFYEENNSENPTKDSWESAKIFISRILEFKDQNSKAYENTTSRFAIKTRLDYSIAELLKFGYLYYSNLISDAVKNNQKDELKKLVGDIENNSEFMGWLEVYCPGYHSNIMDKIDKINAEFQKEIDANFDLIPVLKKIFNKNIDVVDNFLSAETTLDPNDFGKSIDIILPVISKLFETLWIAQVIDKNKYSKLKNTEDKIEQKIFNWFYKTQKIKDFKNKNYFESWCAFGNLLALLWKPNDSRFGTNLEKLIKKYQNEFNQKQYLQTYNYIKILCRIEDKEYSISNAVSKLWDVVWDFFLVGKSLLSEMLKKQQEPQKEFMTAYRNSLQHARIIVLSISQNRKYVANADIASSLIGKTKILLDWHKEFIAEADVTGKNTEEAKTFQAKLTQFLEYLQNYK